MAKPWYWRLCLRAHEVQLPGRECRLRRHPEPRRRRRISGTTQQIRCRDPSLSTQLRMTPSRGHLFPGSCTKWARKSREPLPGNACPLLTQGGVERVRRQPHRTIAGDATEQARAHPRKAGCCLVPRQRHGKRQSPAAVAAGTTTLSLAGGCSLWSHPRLLFCAAAAAPNDGLSPSTVDRQPSTVAPPWHPHC